VSRAVSAFFVLYVLIAGIILMNVVIAVLLDEFIECITEEKESIAKKLVSRLSPSPLLLCALLPASFSLLDPLRLTHTHSQSLSLFALAAIRHSKRRRIMQPSECLVTWSLTFNL
jgi:hypothetical protein